MATSRALLDGTGPFAAALDGYERREGQLEVADAVERAIDEDRVLLCEAGTGTGKTLGYLVPALRCGRRVVVATGSRALQDQIFGQDLPLAQRVLGTDVSALLVKGLSNYLCRRRFAETREAAPSPEVGRALPVVERWVRRTPRGDVAEVDALSEDHPIWRLITSSSDTRLAGRCPHHEACFVTKLKREAERAELLVVNHHLLLADLALRGDHPGSVLPDYDVAIVDEAHKLEDVATTFFGHRMSSHGFEQLATEAVAAAGDEIAPIADRVRATARGVFESLNLELGSHERRALTDETWLGARLDRYHALDEALDALAQELDDTADSPRALSASRRIASMRERLAETVTCPEHRVTFVARESGRLWLGSSPVHVGPELRARLFDRGHAVVLTSASLTTEERFDFVRSRLGLDAPLDAPVDELSVPQPFDHARQALLYTPTDLPAVDAPEFAPRAAERIATLHALTPGGTFVLCTSVRGMRALGSALGHHLGEPPLQQGEAPKATLLDRFRLEGDAVLVATMSFWEGVDVPGAALRLVVIDRLPFPVPSDPLVRARGAQLEAEGASPFRSDSLPRAALTLKQGFGRLIRRDDDRGVVAVLDRRLSTRGYGEALLSSLPPARRTRELEDVEAFWEPAAC